MRVRHPLRVLGDELAVLEERDGAEHAGSIDGSETHDDLAQHTPLRPLQLREPAAAERRLEQLVDALR